MPAFCETRGRKGEEGEHVLSHVLITYILKRLELAACGAGKYALLKLLFIDGSWETSDLCHLNEWCIFFSSLQIWIWNLWTWESSNATLGTQPMYLGFALNVVKLNLKNGIGWLTSSSMYWCFTMIQRVSLYISELWSYKCCDSIFFSVETKLWDKLRWYHFVTIKKTL